MSNRIGLRVRLARWIAPEVVADTDRLRWIAANCTAMRPREGDQRRNMLRWGGVRPWVRTGELRTLVDQRMRDV